MLLAEGDMKACISLAVGGLGFSLMLLSPSSATAATKADVEGKTMCWGGNNQTSFHSGGKLTSSVAGEGTWAVSKSGVAVKLPGGPYSGVIRIMAGGMVEYTGSWAGTSSMRVIGAFCN
jgi:hypothetical protein